jgi:hypothetical protein
MPTDTPIDLPIGCSCGALRGFVRGASRNSVNRCVCYCDDCQSFAHFLECSDRILDPHGGTDIFQTSSGRLEFSKGTERLSCVRLTEKGLLRWYASCCNSPIANILPSRQVPFAGVITNCAAPPTDGPSCEALLGPIRARVNARFAKGNREKLDAYDRAPASMIFRLFGMLIQARLRGEHAHSPFFDPTTRQPITTPHVLTAEERLEVETRRDQP